MKNPKNRKPVDILKTRAAKEAKEEAALDEALEKWINPCLEISWDALETISDRCEAFPAMETVSKIEDVLAEMIVSQFECDRQSCTQWFTERVLKHLEWVERHDPDTLADIVADHFEEYPNGFGTSEENKTPLESFDIWVEKTREELKHRVVCPDCLKAGV